MPKRLVSVGLALVLLMGPVSGLAQQRTKKLSDEQKIIHLLGRTTFGSRPGDVEKVKALGWEKFIEQQLRPESIPDTVAEARLQGLESITLTNAQIAAQYPQQQVLRQTLKARGIELPEGQNQAGPAGQAGMTEQEMQQLQMRRQEAQKVLRELGLRPQPQLVHELQQAKILRAVYSERQLQEVMTDFWFNHFNVFANKGADRVLITSYERDAIRPNVFGKFEDLLLATAKSPAMLFYLDNWLSASPKANPRRPMAPGRYDRGRVGQMPVQPQMPNQQRPQQPPPPRRGGINENYAREVMELHTLGVDGGYTQKDVQEVARCFTGWTIRQPRQGGDFFFNRNIHDDDEKVVLGTKIPPGGGMNDGETVIRLLAKHPSTARFISTKLARKFVSDNPPKSLVDKMSRAFQKTDGNIREVLLVMFKSSEFWAAENYRAKIKTPFEMTVSAVRAVGGETNGGPQFHRWIAQMGEPLFLAQPPTGYLDTAETWVNTGALLERMNFSLALAANRIPGTRVSMGSGSIVDSKSSKATGIADKYIAQVLHGQLSEETRATINKAIAGSQGEGGMSPAGGEARILGLILGSPEFQRQ